MMVVRNDAYKNSTALIQQPFTRIVQRGFVKDKTEMLMTMSQQTSNPSPFQYIA